MKKYKVLLLVVLSGFMILIYLSFNDVRVSKELLIYPILNSRLAGEEDYLKREGQNSTLQSVLIDCQIKKFKIENYAKDTTSSLIYGFCIRDGNLAIGSIIFNGVTFISNDFPTKKRNLNCFTRIDVCKDSSVDLKYKVKFSY